MEPISPKQLIKTIRNLYRTTGLESAFNKARLHNAKRGAKSNSGQATKTKVTDVFIVYTNAADAEEYKDLIEKKMQHIPITFANIALFRKAYPPSQTIKFVGFSTDGNVPLEVVRQMVTGTKFLQFKIE